MARSVGRDVRHRGELLDHLAAIGCVSAVGLLALGLILVLGLTR